MSVTTEHQRGYAKGYAAGKRAADRAFSRDLAAFQREQFRQQAFIAALGTCVGLIGWTRGDKPIETVKDRTKLAIDFADEAVKHFAFTGQVFEGAPDGRAS